MTPTDSVLTHAPNTQPSRLTLWIEGRPPTVNGMMKLHPQTRGRERRDWQRLARQSLDCALDQAGVPKLGDLGIVGLREAWAEGGKDERLALALAHGEAFAPRLFTGEVTVQGRAWYRTGRSVPDPDGLSLAVKWALDAVANAGHLISDSRHHVSLVLLPSPRIEPSMGVEHEAAFMLDIEASDLCEWLR